MIVKFDWLRIHNITLLSWHYLEVESDSAFDLVWVMNCVFGLGYDWVYDYTESKDLILVLELTKD